MDSLLKESTGSEEPGGDTLSPGSEEPLGMKLPQQGGFRAETGGNDN